MKYRLLADTGLLVSELCFGTMTFGGKGFWEVVGNLGQKEADNLVGHAIDEGINFFDTANAYSEGESESILGKALGANRKDVILATKVMSRMGAGPNEIGLSRVHIMHQVEQSLKRLGTDYIDLYQIHGYDPFASPEDVLKTLDDLVRSGKVRYIGCSNLTAWQLMNALDISQYRGLESYKCIQSYYSIACREIERELVPLLKVQSTGLLVWSPLAGGLLSGKFTREGTHDENARRASFDFPPTSKKTYDIIEIMQEIADAQDVSVAQIALSWLLHKEYVTSVIIGVKTEAQLNDNLKAIDLQLSEEELEKLDEVSKLDDEYPGWNQYPAWPEDRIPDKA
jgi:aryl-alcohol dehydrogenase-like predicted oxidoreductase